MTDQVLLMSLDDLVAHVPSATHGVALCGAVMRDPWQCGPAQSITQHAHQLCGTCWERYGAQP